MESAFVYVEESEDSPLSSLPRRKLGGVLQTVPISIQTIDGGESQRSFAPFGGLRELGGVGEKTRKRL